MLRRPHSTNQGLNPKTGSAPSSILHQKLASSRLSCRTSLASVPISPQAIRTKSSPRTKTTKFKYLIYSIFFLFGLFISRFYLPPPAYAIRPVDAKNKNTEKIPKTCPKGSYLNPETNRCRKFKAQKMKTCPRGYFLNVLTHRCNKNKTSDSPSSHSPKQKNNHNSEPNKEPQSPKICPTGSVYNTNTKRCNKIKQPKPSVKNCRSGYFYNHTTKRCNKEVSPTAPKTCPTGSYYNASTKRCRKTSSVSEKTPCRAGQVRNPETGRCHKLASPTTPKVCPEGKILNPATNRCKKPEENQEPKPCKEGYERHPETNRCRKVHQNTGADNPVEVPKLGEDQNKKDEKKDFNGTTAVAGSAAVGLGIAIFQFKSEIFAIIRKIFFHK